MIRIHGRATSSNVQPVMWLASELGLDVERLDVGGAFGGTDTPDYLAMNPMGKIPVMQDGDLTLFESQAIMRYLAAQYGQDALWPATPAARAMGDMWMEWAKTSVGPEFNYKVFWQLVRTPASARDAALVQSGVMACAHLMPIANRQIEQFGWLAGEIISLADFTLGAQLYRYYTLDFEKPDTPALDEYYTRLTNRPAYAEHVMVSYEPLRVAGA